MNLSMCRQFLEAELLQSSLLFPIHAWAQSSEKVVQRSEKYKKPVVQSSMPVKGCFRDPPK